MTCPVGQALHEVGRYSGVVQADPGLVASSGYKVSDLSFLCHLLSQQPEEGGL